jgi:HPP family
MVYAALMSAAVMAIIGVLGFAFGAPILFPSLGPTIFLQTVTPNDASARIWNTLVGHAIGIAAAFAALFLFGAVHAPAAMSFGSITLGRIGATALAVGITVAAQFVLGAEHPPAAATTMLIALGSFAADWQTILLLAAGVALVAGLGEFARRLDPAREP